MEYNYPYHKELGFRIFLYEPVGDWSVSTGPSEALYIRKAPKRFSQSIVVKIIHQSFPLKENSHFEYGALNIQFDLYLNSSNLYMTCITFKWK